MFYRTAGLVLLSAVLSSCASMNKSECVTADWRTVGFEDGAKGKPQTAISDYRKDCAEHGVTPDFSAYQQGHLQGSEQYCTRRNGFIQGRQGASYQNSCPAPLLQVFLPAYQDGKSLYDAKRAVDSARSEIDKQQREQAGLEQDITDKTEQLVADGLVKEQRLVLLEEIEQLKQALLASVKQLPVLQRELRRAEQAYGKLQQRFAAQYGD